MNFRDKVKKVFRRPSSASSTKSKGNGIKIEYYKRGEVPRSKFRGPFDPEHQKRLAAWSFDTAQAERDRAIDRPLSPCATLPEEFNPRCNDNSDEDEGLAPDQVRDTVPPEACLFDSPITVSHDEYARNRQDDLGSSSSTAVDPESYNGSMMTLFAENPPVDPIVQIKESIRFTSPDTRAASPPPTSLGKYMPISPEGLTQALNAVQICS